MTNGTCRARFVKKALVGAVCVIVASAPFHPWSIYFPWPDRIP